MTSDGSFTVFVVREDNLEGEQTRSLLAQHLAELHANSPPGGVFALDLSGLQVPEVTVWSAWRGDSIASIGALKMLDHVTGEVKSMRTHPGFLRIGAAAAILERIIKTARSRGLRQLSLETGSGPAFEPALAMYRSRGFVNGQAFSDYQQNGFSQFLHLRL
jgi:putative acetyltransferase